MKEAAELGASVSSRKILIPKPPEIPGKTGELGTFVFLERPYRIAPQRAQALDSKSPGSASTPPDRSPNQDLTSR